MEITIIISAIGVVIAIALAVSGSTLFVVDRLDKLRKELEFKIDKAVSESEERLGKRIDELSVK